MLRIEYTLDKWLIGWGLLFGVTTFMGYYGGASLYIYKKTGEVIDVV
ncbi:hypothetical protein GACE_0078 [Geoglobus acetivorans]|uniref:Uncharacterized protein n=1 Tax=Geoglobus acetivorans TaxID=565033 RepID=A0A0A7GB98_GEOAI|nr:hypothetical protein GACE_0078 [Geoglobus acetivorans]